MYRNTKAIIDLDIIAQNVQNLLATSKNDYHYGVIKANAYGHGAIPIAKVLLENGVSHLAVAFLDEAIELRRQFPDVPILILGAVDFCDFPICAKYAITVTIVSLAQVKEVFKYQGKRLKVHFKVNTGMNRLGFSSLAQVKEAYALLRHNESFMIEGIFTHFATADNEDTALYIKQYEMFKEIVMAMKGLFFLVHCQNSAAFLDPLVDMSFCNAARIGIALYGYKPGKTKQTSNINLEPAMKLVAPVTNINQVLPGAKVGYDAIYTLDKPGYIASVAIGYCDGVIRANMGREVAINEKRYEIVGKICMDQLMLLVDESIRAGDEVEIFGNNITVTEVSKYLGAIEYEVICLVSDRVPRVYIKDGKECGSIYFRYNDI